MKHGHRPVLVALRALGLGDLLTALPALRALGQAYPGHRRLLVTTAPVAALARHAGVADRVVATAGLAPVALAGPVDIAVNLHGRGPQSHAVLSDLRPGRLVAFASGRHHGPRWHDDEHEVDRWCRLLIECGIPADPSRLEVRPPPVDVPAARPGATVVHPGAASPARRWPADRWAAVVRAEIGAGRDVVVTGGPAEVALGRAVAAAAGLPGSAVLSGATDVLELAAVVAKAGRVVSGDTGVAHLATALGRPSVVLFGPESPARWGPPAGDDRHVALWAGRRGDPHGVVPDAGLLEITVPDVLAALARLPGRPGAEPPASAATPHGAGSPSGR